MARVPAELLSLIFEILEHEKDWNTLKACSLLSHDNHSRVLPLLFKVITLRLRSQPSPIFIRDVVRRISGLCDLFQRRPEARGFVKTFELLDSYPVYNSQWITQQKLLPRLLGVLHSIRQVTFGCDVGFLHWNQFSPELQSSLLFIFLSPSLKMLSLANLGSLPVSALNTCTHYLSLNNVLTLRPESYLPSGLWIEDPPAHPNAQLSYLSVRTESTSNTNATWGVMLTHADKIKVIKWRCWEDPQIVNGMSLPGHIDFGRLSALRKFSVRMSFGKLGRDLLGFVQALESTTRPSNMVNLSISILFPLHHNAHTARDIQTHVFWVRLANTLIQPEYRALKRLALELTVHERVLPLQGTRINSVTEFRNQMKNTLFPLLNLSSLHFKFKVKAF